MSLGLRREGQKEGALKAWHKRMGGLGPNVHDGRCLTLEDTVEFFNLVLELKRTKEEKKDLVAFVRQL